MYTRCLATTVLLMLPAALCAEQIDGGLRSQLGWTDNVYGTSDDALTRSGTEIVRVDKVDDFSVRLSPWAMLSDREGNLTWSLRYQPAYEYYLSETDINGFDHDATAQAVWRMTARTSLTVAETFRSYRSLVRFNENASSPTDPAVFRGRREEAELNQSYVGLNHLLSPRDQISLNAVYGARDYKEAGSVDSFYYSVSSSLRHTLDPRTSVGVTGSWFRQSFDRSIAGTFNTDYYNVSGTLDYDFTPTLRLEVSAGPTLIDSPAQLVNYVPRYAVPRFLGFGFEVNSADCSVRNPVTGVDEPNLAIFSYQRVNFVGCTSSTAFTPDELAILGYQSNAFPTSYTQFTSPVERDGSGALVPLDDSGIGGKSFTYFAQVLLSKRWESWDASLRYSRSADQSGSFGSSSVADNLLLRIGWQPLRLWSFSAGVGYRLLQQASDVALPTAVVLHDVPAPPGVTTTSGNVAAVQTVVVDVDQNALDYQTYSISFNATRRLTQRASAFASVYWYQQDQNANFDPSGGASEASEAQTRRWTNLTFWVGVEWRFDTFKF